MMLEKITTLLKTGTTYNIELAHQLSLSTKTSLWPLERGIKNLLYQAHSQPKIHFDNMPLGDLVYVLKEVMALGIHSADFSLLPEQLYFMPNLRILEITDTALESLPKSLGDLRQLKSLSLKNTAIDHLPDFLLKLTKLESLSLVDNPNLKELSIPIGQLKNLKTLRISKEINLPSGDFDFKIIQDSF